jgi:hypothetical protein
MAKPKDLDRTEEQEFDQIEAAKKVNDPGEAHRKGYSADPPGTKPSKKPAIPLRPEVPAARPDVPAPERH